MLDRRTPAHGSFHGVVSVIGKSPASPMLHWQEAGTMTWPGYEGPASRSYRIEPTGDARVLEVMFADGRPFHQLDLRNGQWRTSHHCSPDMYQVAYTAVSAVRLDYDWEVHGPAKDLLIRTSLQRKR